MQVRFKTDDVVIHLASAGSGKTTAAMNEIASALREYRPDEIAFVTYTKKGVENGIERALKVNPDLTPDDLMHFKTLHALCFREAHLTRKNMMSSDDIARFNEAFGFSLSLSDAFGYVSEDDRLLQRYDAQRSGSRRGVFVDGNFDRFRYDRLVNAYEAFKEAHGLVDFFDCLTLYMERGEPLKGVKLAVIDECFAPGTLVRMGDGSVRPIKNVREGDYVMGVRGPVRVTAIHKGRDVMYNVLSGKKKLMYTCNSLHRIQQRYVEDERYKWSPCSCVKKRAFVEVIGIEGKTQVLRTSPYFLGLWLGNGLSREAAVVCNENDKATIEWLRDYGESRGDKVTLRHRTGIYQVEYSLQDKRPGAKCHIRHELESYGFMCSKKSDNPDRAYNEKRIPPEFLAADKKQRYELLAGLIDSDGMYVKHGKHNHKYRIEMAREPLMRDIYELLCSLGLNPTWYETTHTTNGKKGTYYRVDFYGNSEIRCLLPRKKYIRTVDESRIPCHIEAAYIGEYVGITVDSPDHLFLLANGCVVHNCQDLTALQWQVCMKAFAGAERIRCFGDDFQCQPEGTIVHTENGGMPIELCDGKRLLTYDMNEGIYKMSDPVELAVRDTDEPLYEVRMRLPDNTFYNYGSGISYFTGNHKLIVRDMNRWNIRTRTVKECLGKTSGLLVPWFNIEHGVLSSILPDWIPFDVSISRVSPGAPYKVYSLNVPEFHTYVADGGITVHNCLYTYNGAAPELLVEMASHYETVKHETSYRLPRKVYEFARGITDVIQEKVEKDYRPATDREGFVRELGDRNVLARVIRDDLRANGPKPGRWYLLFRTNCFIADMAKTLEQFIVPYHTVKGFCIPKRELARIERYYNFRKEGFGSAESRARFAEEYKIKDFNESFTESELIPGRERYFFQDLVDAYGIKALKAMCDMDEPWLLLSTVHRVKGGEADYTAMFMDCTRVVSENMTLSADDELRVLYVGCTRCREGLYLIPAQGKYSMSRLLDIVREVNDV